MVFSHWESKQTTIKGGAQSGIISDNQDARVGDISGFGIFWDDRYIIQ
jgi:hypothetical protein